MNALLRLLGPPSLAVALLTRIPVTAKWPHELPLGASLPFFVPVGYLLGAGLWAAAAAVQPLPAPWLWATLLVAGFAGSNGALHLDGVADLFDALGGGAARRERMLEIMRDPRIGAHGASALVLLLVAKVAAFEYALHGAPAALWVVLPALSRGSVVPLAVLFGAARPQGLAHRLCATARPWHMAVAVLCLVVPVRVLAPALWLPCLAGASVSLALGLWARAKLGGLTGDIHGAAIELCELTYLATWVATH